MRWREVRWRLAHSRDPDRECGSTIPLILGFFLIALLFVGGAVMASEAFSQQRQLQSICDGAASAGVNSIDYASVRDHHIVGDSLPLGAVQGSIDTYLVRDPGRSTISAVAAVSGDQSQLQVNCSTASQLPFQGLLGHPNGIRQTATSLARSPIG